MLVCDKTEPSQSFPAAFYLHETKSLEGLVETEKFIEMPIDLIRSSAPDSLSIPEIRSSKQFHVFSKLYKSHPLLSDSGNEKWSVAMLTELHRANDADLYKTDAHGWWLIEGKNFHQFIPDFEKPIFRVNSEKGLNRTAKHRVFKTINESFHEAVRLGFRKVASSTNVRVTIACILPPHTFSPDSVILIVPTINDSSIPNGMDYSKMISYLCAIFNSFVFDFLVRTRVSMNLNYFYIYQTPVPVDIEGNIAKKIIGISGRLSCVDERYDALAKDLGIRIAAFDMKERIEMLARLNILVAQHYGITKEDFEVIAGSFGGFKEDAGLLKMRGEIKWDDELIRKFNGEVKKMAIQKFDSIVQGSA